jgi:hypothetical protein
MRPCCRMTLSWYLSDSSKVIEWERPESMFSERRLGMIKHIQRRYRSYETRHSPFASLPFPVAYLPGLSRS